jgi:hypothetical protein
MARALERSGAWSAEQWSNDFSDLSGAERKSTPGAVERSGLKKVDPWSSGAEWSRKKNHGWGHGEE